MKGSPLFSTLTAILLMAAAYLWLHLTLYSAQPIENQTSQNVSSINALKQEAGQPENRLDCYIEAHFSTPPSKFTIKDPISGKVIASELNLTDIEWTGEVILAKSDSAELNIYAEWKSDHTEDSTRQNFIQIILSPDQMEDSHVTLRSDGVIDSTATFQLRK